MRANNPAPSQDAMNRQNGNILGRIQTASLEIAYEESGAADGRPVILMHGFPYDPRAYDDVACQLAGSGYRVIVPYMRGYGPTRFLDGNTLRSGEQAAFGADLLALMDALHLDRPILAGYDWGGRAACIVAALWPERVAGLVTVGGYNIFDNAASQRPLTPAHEHRLWYQYYFHSERGRTALEQDRRGLCRYIWSIWSPSWQFDEATFERTAQSFDNPDFVEVVIHSYGHRFGLAPGDPAFTCIEHRLSEMPEISVPTIILHGADDGVSRPEASLDQRRFTGFCDRKLVEGAGHNLPQEKPGSVVEAVLALAAMTTR